MKDFLLNKLDKQLKVQCSNAKSEDFKFLPLGDALEYNFLRFGNNYFIPAVSIDIDHHVDIRSIVDDYNIPDPTFIVTTSKGFHVHWFLEHPIKTSNVKQIKKLRHILTYLQRIFEADEHATAVNSGRIWRNPLKHSTYFSHNIVHFCEFDLPEVLMIEQLHTRKGAAKYEKQLLIDFSTVMEGHRNSSLFEFGSAYALATGCTDVLDVMCKKNEMMRDPLPLNEVVNTANSIANFMTNKYKKGDYKTSDRTIEFNRKVAKRQADKKFDELYKLVATSLAPIFSLKKLTARRAAEIYKVSKNTWTKYRDKLVEKFKELIKASGGTFSFLQDPLYRVSGLSNQQLMKMQQEVICHYARGPS